MIFGCHHSNTTFPRTVKSARWPNAKRTYTVCLNCGAEFEYDMQTMRRGKRIERKPEQPDLVAFARKAMA